MVVVVVVVVEVVVVEVVEVDAGDGTRCGRLRFGLEVGGWRYRGKGRVRGGHPFKVLGKGGTAEIPPLRKMRSSCSARVPLLQP